MTIVSLHVNIKNDCATHWADSTMPLIGQIMRQINLYIWLDLQALYFSYSNYLLPVPGVALCAALLHYSNYLLPISEDATN